jgi:hypothetical protein
MQKPNSPVDGRLDATILNEQRRVDRSPSTDESNPPSDQLPLNIEMAVEWAHLGGD